jgi:erythromycin esterase-like protein
MYGLVAAIREWNRSHGADRQIGFYGFEIPSGAHAVATVLGLPDAVAGHGLNLWLRTQLACVANDESAHWGLEGRASDSTFWNQCGTIVSHVADSIAALHARVSASSPAAANVAYADEMARLLNHYVSTGLRHLARQEGDAAHVMYVVNSLGGDARLLVWGGDIEMGRLVQNRTTIQTGVPLGTQLGAQYRAIAFAIGGGHVRTRRPGTGPMGNQPGFGSIQLHTPEPDSYENVLTRATRDAYWLDLRDLPSDAAGAWLRGPHPMRLITDLYTPDAPQLFDIPVEFPKNYDGVVFIRTAKASR